MKKMKKNMEGKSHLSKRGNFALLKNLRRTPMMPPIVLSFSSVNLRESCALDIVRLRIRNF